MSLFSSFEKWLDSLFGITETDDSRPVSEDVKHAPLPPTAGGEPAPSPVLSTQRLTNGPIDSVTGKFPVAPKVRPIRRAPFGDLPDNTEETFVASREVAMRNVLLNGSLGTSGTSLAMLPGASPDGLTGPGAASLLGADDTVYQSPMPFTPVGSPIWGQIGIVPLHVQIPAGGGQQTPTSETDLDTGQPSINQPISGVDFTSPNVQTEVTFAVPIKPIGIAARPRKIEDDS